MRAGVIGRRTRVEESRVAGAKLGSKAAHQYYVPEVGDVRGWAGAAALSD